MEVVLGAGSVDLSSTSPVHTRQAHLTWCSLLAHTSPVSSRNAKVRSWNTRREKLDTCILANGSRPTDSEKRECARCPPIGLPPPAIGARCFRVRAWKRAQIQNSRKQTYLSVRLMARKNDANTTPAHAFIFFMFIIRHFTVSLLTIFFFFASK